MNNSTAIKLQVFSEDPSWSRNAAQVILSSHAVTILINFCFWSHVRVGAYALLMPL